MNTTPLDLNYYRKKANSLYYDNLREPAKAILELCAEVERLRKVAEPEWIVNDLGELGVKLGERFFFLYKGGNIEYDGLHSDDETPMLYRIVGKREFGETCHPLKWILAGRSEARYTEELVYTPGLSFGSPDDGKWKPLPSSATAPKDKPLVKSAPEPKPEVSSWPPRVQITPEGAAGIFILTHFKGQCGKDTQDALAELLKVYWRGGYDTAKKEQSDKPCVSK